MRLITDINIVKEIQLDILSALDKFCEENDIDYTIIDGTLLGAVRHKGYIPWDDDIDVAMDRANYDKFIQIFPKFYESKFKLISLERDRRWDRAYACMYDNRTQLKYIDNSSFAPGILIDVFPIDEVPDDEAEWKKLKTKMLIYSKLSALKSSKSFYSSHSFIKNIIASIFKVLLLPISKRRIALLVDKMAKSYNGRGYCSGYETTFGVGARERFKLIDFKETIYYPFEDRNFKGLKNADSVLTDIYGDYMQLPPLDKRVAHHTFEAYWK